MFIAGSGLAAGSVRVPAGCLYTPDSGSGMEIRSAMILVN